MSALLRVVRRTPQAVVLGLLIAALMAGVFVPMVFALYGSRGSWSVTSDPLSVIALGANALVLALFIAARRGRPPETGE